MRCPSCGTPGAADGRYCHRCGAQLPSVERPDPLDRPATQRADLERGDRRIVTALFADLVDYVRMLAEHDPEVVRARVRTALGTMAEAVTRFGGTREKFIGDAVFAVFGWPEAHDDDAVRAALAALSIRDGLRMIGDGVEPMEVRIGIATGEVVTSDEAGDPSGDLGLTGEAITTAARIQSLAHAGEIMLDGATVAAARGRLATEDRGSVVLRGQSTAVGLHALRGEVGTSAWIPHRPAAPGPLVGRAHEMAVLQTVIDRSRRTGRGAVVVVEGDAGLGKSRLLAAAQPLAVEAGFAWTWTENLSYRQGEPYRWARLIAQTVADEQGVDSGAFTRRLLFTDDLDAGSVRRFGGAIAAIARDAAFSGWEDEAKDMPADSGEVSAALAEVARRYLERLLASTGPRVVVIDDLHWLDVSSVGMVEILVEMATDHPLLVFAATRPGPHPAWAERPDTVRLTLQGLDLPETARLATLVARAAVDADGAERIHERTAGNPLFVAETVRAFLADGTLRLRHGRVQLAKADGGRLPVTLRAVLGARIDGLEREEREVLSVAAVIGVTFRARQVEDLLGRPVPSGALEHLVTTSLIGPGDDGTWRFAHPLIRDVAYAGVLASRRRVLHGRFADHLEATQPAISRVVVAAHRAAAGDVGRAVPLLREAAEAALAVGAGAEAASFWRRAAELLAPTDPDSAAADMARAAEALAAATPGSPAGG